MKKKILIVGDFLNTELWEAYLNADGFDCTSVGTMMQAVYFGLWLAVLSWEDLSVALPLQALSYIVVAFLAQWFLGENVSTMRWAGICLICVGVAMITRSSVS